jgi:hypothetical protein
MFILLHTKNLRHGGKQLIQTITSLNQFEANGRHEQFLCFHIDLFFVETECSNQSHGSSNNNNEIINIPKVLSERIPS